MPLIVIAATVTAVAKGEGYWWQANTTPCWAHGAWSDGGFATSCGEAWRQIDIAVGEFLSRARRA